MGWTADVYEAHAEFVGLEAGAWLAVADNGLAAFPTLGLVEVVKAMRLPVANNRLLQRQRTAPSEASRSGERNTHTHAMTHAR